MCESASWHPEPADFGEFSIVVLHAPLEDLQQKLCQSLCCVAYASQPVSLFRDSLIEGESPTSSEKALLPRPGLQVLHMLVPARPKLPGPPKHPTSPPCQEGGGPDSQKDGECHIPRIQPLSEENRQEGSLPKHLNL